MTTGTGTAIRPVWKVWLLLAAASLAGTLMAEGLVPVRVATTCAFLLAALKIHLIFGQYMELNWRHAPLRHLLAGWLTSVTAILLVCYWIT